MAGPSTITRSGAKAVAGFDIELQRELSKRWALALRAVHEGDSGMANRNDGFIQGVYIAPRLGSFEFSGRVGIGLGKENNEENNENRINMLGIAGMRTGLYLNDNWLVFLDLNRIISGNHLDGDSVRIGLGRKF